MRMRVVVIIGSVLLAACTASVPAHRTPIAQRVAEACDDLASLCTAAGSCDAQATFCGAQATALDALFVTEDACKTSCSGATPCLKTCKATRTTAMTGLIGPTTSTTCASLSSTCSTSGQGCLGGEFFCPLFAPAPSPCATQLDTCKAACAPHDRTCLRTCRDQYRQCLAGPTPDAGVMADAPTTTTPPDAPTTTPDAPTTKPDAPTTTPDAPATTTTNYTYTNDIQPKMTGLCNGCHSGSSAPAGYLTDSYSGLFGNGSDTTPNIVPGDGTSLFVQKIAGNHHNVLTLYPGFDKVSYDWVVNNNAQK